MNACILIWVRIKQVKEGNYDMINDRNYYEQCDDSFLIALGKDGSDELALVLAKRLAAALLEIEVEHQHALAHLEAEIEDLKAELDEARATINFLETELENAQ